MDLETREWIVLGVVLAAVVVLGALLIGVMVRRRSARRSHTEALRRQFGDDYDATVARLGRKAAEAELDERIHRFREMELDRVSPDSRDEMTERWKEIQYRFLEDPSYSVRESEHLISALMRERGFPDGGFETRARALSMAHAELADPYREAYATFRATEDGSVTVVKMFDAMHRYRELFEALLERPKREAGVEGSAPPSSEPGPSGTGPRSETSGSDAVRSV